MSRDRARTPAAGVQVPRAVTPDDEVLEAAIEKIRAIDPEWQLANQIAVAFESEQAARQAGEDRIEDLEKDKDNRDDALSGLRKWLWGSAGGAVAALATAIYAAIGAAGDAGEKRGAERERELRQLEDRKVLFQVRERQAVIGLELAELRGRLTMRRSPSPRPEPQE